MVNNSYLTETEKLTWWLRYNIRDRVGFLAISDVCLFATNDL